MIKTDDVSLSMVHEKNNIWPSKKNIKIYLIYDDFFGKHNNVTTKPLTCKDVEWRYLVSVYIWNNIDTK